MANETAVDQLAKQLWALGDLARLRLLAMLPSSPDCSSGNNVSQLAEKLGVTQPTVSHHLRVLRQAGFVDYNKMCRDCFYWRNEEAISATARKLCEELGQ